MGRTRLIERAGRVADVVARAGHDTATFASELVERIQMVVPHCASCVITLDPATGLLTGTYKFGDLSGMHDLDEKWAEIEYGSEDPTRMSRIAEGDLPAMATSQLPGGSEDSVRMRELVGPAGFVDELRMVALSNGQAWGGVNLFRRDDVGPFDPAEVEALAAISGSVGEGLRGGLIVRCATVEPSSIVSGPLVLIMDGASAIRRVSAGADDLLAELSSEPNRSPVESMIGSIIAHARRFVEGTEAELPRARFRLPSGRWLVANGAPLSGPDGATGEVVVTIDDARPPEIVPLLAAAYGLTDREREVTELVLTGTDTKGIAAELSMSPYTVQDHLKSIFEKADVRSRRELMARVFFDHHAPRLTDELAPSGWFRS